MHTHTHTSARARTHTNAPILRSTLTDKPSRIDMHVPMHTLSCLPLPHTEQLLVVRAPHPSLRQPPSLSLLPCIVTPSLPILFPPSSRLWQLLIHVAALQMSQLTSWESSGMGEETGLGGGVCEKRRSWFHLHISRRGTPTGRRFMESGMIEMTHLASGLVVVRQKKKSFAGMLEFVSAVTVIIIF